MLWSPCGAWCRRWPGPHNLDTIISPVIDLLPQLPAQTCTVTHRLPRAGAWQYAASTGGESQSFKCSKNPRSTPLKSTEILWSCTFRIFTELTIWLQRNKPIFIITISVISTNTNEIRSPAVNLKCYEINAKFVGQWSKDTTSAPPLSPSAKQPSDYRAIHLQSWVRVQLKV